MIISKNFEEKMKKKMERWCNGGAIHHKRRVGRAWAPTGDKGRGNMETVRSTGSNRDGKGSPAGMFLPEDRELGKLGGA